VPTSAASFLDESQSPSAASFLDEGRSASSFLDAATHSNEIPQFRAVEEPGIIRRGLTAARESLSPLIGYTENQKLRQAQERAQLAGALPQIVEQADASRPNIMATEGALPGIFTPSETQPIQLPQIGQQEGALAQVGAGIYNPVAGAVNSAIASPGGMLTLPLSGPISAVRPVGALVGRLFAADMARQTIENTPQAYETITDPNKTLQQKVEAGTGVATTAALSGLGAVHSLDARLAGKTPEQQSRTIREEVKVTEDKRVADALTDAADQIDREIAARDAAEVQAKEQQRVIEQQQKAAADAQKAQADAAQVAAEPPKSTQILQENQKSPSIANVATEAGTQTSPYALQGELNKITNAPAPAVNPALPEVAPPASPAIPEGLPAVEAPRTAAEIKSADIKRAVDNPKTQYQFTVQQGGEGYPGYVQVDAILPSAPEAQMRNTVSSSVKDLNKAGAKLPEVPDWVPTGQYTRAEIEALIKKGPPDANTERAAGPADRNTDLGPDQANNATAAETANQIGGTEDALQKQSANESVLRGEAPQPQLDVGLREVGKGNAQSQEVAGNVARQETSSQPEVEAAANEKINALNESRLVALADQLGIKTMGMSGERLRSRIISNAFPEDIVGAIDNPAPPKTPTRGKIKGSKIDKWADEILKQGRALSGFDPELLAAHTVKLAGQLETGAVKFADWSAEKIKEAGEAIRPYLQQIWDAAHEQIAAKPGERVLAGDNRGTSRSALGKYDYVKTSNADQIANGKAIVDYVKKTGDYEGGFAKLREIQNSADRAVSAASMIPEAENIVDPMARDRVIARLFREAKGVGTDVAQGLQAPGTVNELIEPYRGHLAWMDLIQSRLQDEVVPKFPENSADIINKGVKDAGNKAAAEIASDTPGASSVLKGAITRIKKSTGIDWQKVFTDLPEKQAERKAEIFRRINEDPKVASLPEAAKTKLAETMEQAWENLRNKEFRKQFEKVVGSPNIGKVEKIALEKAYPELVAKANLGLLDNQAFLDAMGRQYGIPSLDSDTGQKLRDLGQKAARTPAGSERNAVYQEIMDTIMQARGVNPWDFLKDYWYRNVMSAPRTAVEIGAGGIIQGAARTFTTAVDTAVRQGQPGLALRMIGMFLKDAGTGARLGADLVVSGDRSILPRYTEQFLKKMQNLEEGKSPGGEIESLYRRSGGLQKAALTPFEMTGRLLTALDYIGGQGVRSQQMLYSALTRGDKVSFEAAMRRFNTEEVAKAEKQAREELGTKARPAQIIARKREILNEGIDKSIQDFGNTMTEVVALNAPPAGISGEIYKAVSKIPMMVRAPAGLAFAKAGLNVFQELTNWAPITGQINLARSLWREPGKNNPLRFLALDKLPPERARQLVVAQATGLAVLTAAASKFLGKQPEDEQNKPREWEISGPWTGLTPTQKSALMSAGERPLSIKLPDGRWVDYKLTPFMSALATIGHIRDQERFNGKKYNDEEAANKAVNAWLMGLASVKDLSLASSFSRLAGFLATDDRQLNADGVTKTLADSVGNAAVGLIPMSSLLRELDNTTDGQRYRSDKKNPGVDLWLTQVPFVRRFVNDGKPLLNFLGEPVNVDTNPFNRHIGPGPSTAQVEAALSEKVGLGMKLPSMSDNTTIVGKDGKQRPMTGEELYDYQKSVRQGYARQIASDLPIFQRATPEEASLYSQQVFTNAERYARDRLNTGAQWNGVIPVDPKLTSALSPEYKAVKELDSYEGSKSALAASRMRVNYDNFINAPQDQRGAILQNVLKNGTPNEDLKFIHHATSNTTNRTALERATSGLTAPGRAEFFTTELAKRTTPDEKRAFLLQQFKAGLINKDVLREMAAQAQKN